MQIETKFICLEDPAFYQLVDRLVERIKQQENIKEDKWLTIDEAMTLLHVDSKTTFLKIRDAGNLEFSKVTERVILYSRNSITAYIESQSHKTF